MTCKDCVHLEVCVKLYCENCYGLCDECGIYSVEGKKLDVNNCNNFKDGSKQIPQKPLPEERYYGVGKCPTCNAVFLNTTTNYCGNCGQALDWGEKTEI